MRMIERNKTTGAEIYKTDRFEKVKGKGRVPAPAYYHVKISENMQVCYTLADARKVAENGKLQEKEAA